MNINQIADEARESISTYCLEECNAYCCRKGTLILNKEELHLITQGKHYESIIKIKEDKYSLNLDQTCPRLIKGVCSIHKNPKRPNTCKKFPLFIQGKTIHLSNRCPAVRANKFYPYEHQFIELGFKIE